MPAESIWLGLGPWQDPQEGDVRFLHARMYTHSEVAYFPPSILHRRVFQTGLRRQRVISNNGTISSSSTRKVSV